MAPLTGRPPFATNEPDSFYESGQPAARRRPPPARPEQNNRSSAYDVYDNYLDAGAQPGAQNRTSGVGAAFMNGDMDDSDSEDEDRSRNFTRRPMDPHHTPVSIPVPEPAASSKHAALAAATGARKGSPTPPPQYRAAPPTALQPAAIAAPRPGYAAQISALNNSANSQGGGRQVPPGIQVPAPNNPHVQQDSPSPTSPHPLQAPITPIQPVFARPRPPKNGDVKFTGDIMRGDKEESMIPKRGEKGDDFWRRFSMVVKDEGTKRGQTSSWLRKTTNGTSSFARWVWIVGIILVIAAAGGIGIGWYVSHKGPDHYQPTAIGGSANEAGSVSSSVKAVGSGGSTAKSTLHVSPTNTVARRDDDDDVVHITADWTYKREATFTAAPQPTVAVHEAQKRRLHAKSYRH